MRMYWPIFVIVLSSVCYQTCAKSLPDAIHPLAALVISYTVGAVLCAVLYFILNRNGNLLREYEALNLMPFLIGVALVGLEIGTIYMYKVGWAINTGYMVHSALIAVALVLVGFLCFHEAVTVSKVMGIAICMVGLYFINK